ncbi:MAG: TIGR03905 family TSCPD domain-containing protein [Clostridia bacterium]|nr:TIGR03905 family TSCPD domain-containing protein [Clostridia bacterium]MBR3862505.1 TIGR03905 family TSCPD domain-containing protein [Clostridia bacterium]
MEFAPRGVCAKRIHITLEGEIIKEVSFMGGCAGNTQGVAALVAGMPATEAIARLEGIRCGFKSTSCPDQLAKALRMALEDRKEA